ncbi:DUF3597 domain-containing protein [Mesorhizobium sp. SB112]|uniref:DUF3597 domain-containing protein n=1 Tax=Mesorhizobium sp. SB112 TaxID=3151853 RepID=UPI00326515CD
MGIFDKIKGAIFGSAQAAPAPKAEPASPTTPSAAPSTPSAAPAPAPSAPPATSSAPVDVAAVLEKAVASKGQKLNWRTSIVDLMKALDLDSSLGARKELAKELNYTGDTGDSATMNVWLHKALMKKLAENGGKVPDDLKD